MSDDVLADLLRVILSRPDGVYVVTEILNMRFHEPKKDGSAHSQKLIALARDALSNYPFTEGRGRRNKSDHDLTRIVDVCLNGEDGVAAASEICRHFVEAVNAYSVYSFDHPSLLNSLARVQPITFLNEFLGNSGVEDCRRSRIFSDDFERHNNPLNQISDMDIIHWCEIEAEGRYSQSKIN